MAYEAKKEYLEQTNKNEMTTVLIQRMLLNQQAQQTDWKKYKLNMSSLSKTLAPI